MSTTTTNTLSPAMVTYYQKQILPNVQPMLIWGQFGQVGRVPRKNGKVTQWRKYGILPEAEQLAEGIIPVGQALSQTQVTAERKAYGDYVKFTDESVELTIDEVMEDSVPLISDQVGRTMDSENRAEVNSGTSVRRVGGHALRIEITASNKLDWNFLRKLHRDMTKRSVPRFPEYGNTYVLIISPDTKVDLMDDPKFTALVNSNTVDPEKRVELNRIGTYYGWTVFETDRPQVYEGAGADGIDVHASIALGKNAYGVSKWEDPRLIVKGFDTGGPSNPLEQLATVGWKGAWVTKILQELFMERIEHAVSA